MKIFASEDTVQNKARNKHKHIRTTQISEIMKMKIIVIMIIILIIKIKKLVNQTGDNNDEMKQEKIAT